MCSYNPSFIFDLAQKNPEVKLFLDRWINGSMDFNTCILEMREALIKRCFEVDEQWDLGFNISRSMFDVCSPVEPATYSNNAMREYLKKQENTIRSIHLVANCYQMIFEAALAKSANSKYPLTSIAILINEFND